MKKLAFVLFLIVLSADAFGQARCGSSERFGNQLIRVGDSERRVIEVAGRPDMQRQLETRQGGAAGIRMDYYQSGRTIQIYVQGGQVTRICWIRD